MTTPNTPEGAPQGAAPQPVRADGSPWFTFDNFRQLEEQFDDDPRVLNELLAVTGSLPDAQAALFGPSRAEVLAARENADDAELQALYDDVYGQGAFENALTARSWQDHVSEVIPQVLGGAQEAAGNFGLFVSDTISGNENMRRLRRNALIDAARTIRGERVVITDEELATVSAGYRQRLEAETRLWSDDRRRRTLAGAREELQFVEERWDALVAGFSSGGRARYARDNPQYPHPPTLNGVETTADLRTYREQLRVELEVLSAEPEMTSEERYEARRVYARRVGAAGFPGMDPVEVPETLTGEIVSGVSQFASASGAPGGLLATVLRTAGRGAAAILTAETVTGMFADATAFDPESPQLLDFVEQQFGVDMRDTFVDYIRKDEDDTDARRRLLGALEGAGVGLAVSTLLLGASRAVSAIRRRGGSPEEVAAEMESALQQAVDEVQAASETPTAAPQAPQEARPADPAPQAQETPQAVSRPAQEAPEMSIEESVEAALQRDMERPTDRAEARLADPAARTRGVVSVRQVMERVRAQLDGWLDLGQGTQVLRETVETIARESPTIFRENRTDDALLVGASGHLTVIMDHVRAGRVNNAIAYATDARTPASFTDMAFAYRSAASILERATSLAMGNLRATKATPNVAPEVLRAAEVMFDRVFDAYSRIRVVDANIGSWWGAFGRQRRSLYTADEASEFAMLSREADFGDDVPTRTPVDQRDLTADQMREAIESLEMRRNEGTHFWQWYNRLRSGGADPVDAFDLISDYLREERRVGARAGNVDPKPPKGVENPSTVSNILDGITRYRYEAMLSAPDTHIVSYLSTVGNFLRHTTSLGMVAPFRRGGMTAYIDRLSGMMWGLKENVLHTLQSARMAHPVLDPNAHLLEGAGKLPRIQLLRSLGPLRLLAMNDQFFSGLLYRGEIAARASREAQLLRMGPEARRAYVRAQIKDSLTDRGAARDQLALHHAREITLQAPLNRKSKYIAERAQASIVDFINHRNPYLRTGLHLGFAFTRIFFTLVDRGIRLSPAIHVPLQIIKKGLGGGNTRFYDDLMGVNGSTSAAIAAGELALGTALTGAALTMALEGNITGGASSPWVMDPLTNQAVPPYHIRIGDRWVPYDRYEPFSTPLKLIANLVEATRRVEDGRLRVEQETFYDRVSEAIGVIGFTLGEVVTSNPFMKTAEGLLGIGQSLTNEESQNSGAERLAGTMIDSFIPNLLRKFNEDQEGGVRFTGTSLESRIMRHFTFLDPDNWNMDVARNPITGEVLVNRTPFTALDPVDDAALHDPVAEMLLEGHEATGRTFELRGPRGWAGIDPRTDLRDVLADDGQRSLYDLFLEGVSETRIDGRTYRESLAELFESPEFQAMSWGNSTRVRSGDRADAVMAVRDEYQRVARDAVMAQDSYQALIDDQERVEELFAPARTGSTQRTTSAEDPLGITNGQ